MAICWVCTTEVDVPPNVYAFTCTNPACGHYQPNEEKIKLKQKE